MAIENPAQHQLPEHPARDDVQGQGRGLVIAEDLADDLGLALARHPLGDFGIAEQQVPEGEEAALGRAPAGVDGQHHVPLGADAIEAVVAGVVQGGDRFVADAARRADRHKAVVGAPFQFLDGGCHVQARARLAHAEYPAFAFGHVVSQPAVIGLSADPALFRRVDAVDLREPGRHRILVAGMDDFRGDALGVQFLKPGLGAHRPQGPAIADGAAGVDLFQGLVREGREGHEDRQIVVLLVAQLHQLITVFGLNIGQVGGRACADVVVGRNQQYAIHRVLLGRRGGSLGLPARPD